MGELIFQLNHTFVFQSHFAVICAIRVSLGLFDFTNHLLTCLDLVNH